MPHATTRPSKVNKTAGGFTLKIGGNLIGDVTEGNLSIGKDNIDINDALKSRPKSRLEFLQTPIIECVCVDIHWDTISEILGIPESTVTAGTDDYATDVGFPIYQATMAYINADSSKNTATDIVLNTAADGAGDDYTENTDYIVDSTRAMVQTIGEQIADGATVYVKSGKYATSASKRILMYQDKIDTENNITLEHTFSDGETLSIYLYKANVTSPLEIQFPFNRTDLVSMPLTITGLIDTDYDGSEYGYIDITTS